MDVAAPAPAPAPAPSPPLVPEPPVAVRSILEWDALGTGAAPVGCVARVVGGPVFMDAAAGGARPPLDLVAAVDCSSSMRQAMHLLRQTMTFVTAELAPTDRLAIVCYATHASVTLPLRA